MSEGLDDRVEGEWRDEDLLEWLLDEPAREGAEREVLESQPEVGERLRELEAFLADCRESLEVESRAADPSDPALVDRILFATTREDLSWRGDLRLVGGFLRQRLQASVLLRVVAASLLLHVVALPVLAYYTLVVIPAKSPLLFDVQTEPAELPYEEHAPEPDREVVEPVIGALDEPSLAGRLRLERLRRYGRINLDGFSAAPIDTEVWFDSLGLVLWCEQLMDELEAPDAGPARARLLEHALAALRGQLAVAGDGAVDRLAASAWLRAEASGWGEADAQLAESCRELVNDRSNLTEDRSNLTEDRGLLTKDGGFLSGRAWKETYREADGAGE